MTGLVAIVASRARQLGPSSALLEGRQHGAPEASGSRPGPTDHVALGGTCHSQAAPQACAVERSTAANPFVAPASPSAAPVRRPAGAAAPAGEHASSQVLVCHLDELTACSRNVVGLVQRCLRESYLLTNDSLADYAERLRSMNELRDELRTEAQRVRETLTRWSELARQAGDEQRADDVGVAALEVDDVGLVLRPQLTQSTQAAVPDVRAPGSPEGRAALADVERLFGPSTLTASQRDLLDELAAEFDDDDLEEMLDELWPVLSSLNDVELRRYVGHVLRRFARGNTDEDAILQVFEHLSPVQRLHMLAEGFTARYFGLGDDDARAFRLLARGAAREVAAELGVELDLGRVELSDDSAAAPVASAEVSARLAADLLAQLAARGGRPATASARANDEAPLDTASATPRLLRTTQELADYQAMLEDEQNSVGDAAQLANVDLQQLVQRQQQTLQQLSSLTKVVFEAAISVCRRISA